VRATFSTKYEDPEAAEMLEQEFKPFHAVNPLVQISDASL